MATGDTYAWENVDIESLLSRLSGMAKYDLTQGVANADKIISALVPGETSLGAQQQSNAYALMQKVQETADAKLSAAMADLKKIDPYFDVNKYIDPKYQLYDPGEGASANRSAPIINGALKVSAQMDAIKKATEAAQKFKQTGKFEPYPDYTTELKGELNRVQSYLATGARNPGMQAYASKLGSLANGTALSVDAMAQANASAARVGAPLPYPNGGIGKIADGGVFTSADEAKGFYNPDGTLNSQALQKYSQYEQAGKANPNGPSYQTGQTSSASNGANAPSGGNAPVAMGSSGALDLVKQALLSGDVNNLAQKDFWSNNPNKTEAYQILQNSFSDPKQLGQLVQGLGLTDLQKYPWWNNYAQKADAWSTIQNLNAGGAGTTGSSGGATTTTGGTSGVNGGASAGATGSADIQSALDFINNSDLDPSVKALFGEIVQGWDPSKEISHQNIIDQFNKIKSETIDPYFAEQANIFIDDIKRTEGYAASNRSMELEQEKMVADQNIQNTQNNLEARGMTFSGEATTQLGNDSAYGSPGQNPNSVLPTQAEFYKFGQSGEGQVQASNRLMSTSSNARYQKTLTDLARNAEQVLGSEKSKNLVSGVPQMGNISGSLNQQKNQQEASTLSNLYQQEQDNYQQDKQINLFK